MTLVVVGFFVLFYTLISIPAFTNVLKERVSKELSILLGGKVQIENLEIFPFNEIKISGLEVYDPKGDECLKVETIGAGIRLWKLIFEGDIELTYGEIIGLDATIIQDQKNGPLNIDFIIKALSNKDNKKEKKIFNLALRNVVLRKSSASFSRPWLQGEKIGLLDLSHLEIKDLAADITFPKISNDGVEVDLRRLSFKIPDIIELETLKFKGDFGDQGLFVQNFLLELPSSRIFIPNIDIPAKDDNLLSAFKTGNHNIKIIQSYLTPSDFAFLWSSLSNFNEPLPMELEVAGNLEDIIIENFKFGNSSLLSLSFNGKTEGLSDIKSAKSNISDFRLLVDNSLFSKLLPLFQKIPPKVIYALKKIGNLQIDGDFVVDMNASSLKGNLDFLSEAFNISFEGNIQSDQKAKFLGQGEFNINDLRLHHLFPSIPINNIDANIIAEGSLNGKNPEGIVSLVIDNFELKGKKYDGLSFNISKNDNMIEADLFVNNEIADISAQFNGDILSETKNINLDIDIEKLNLSEIAEVNKYRNYLIAGSIKGQAKGTQINDITGDLSLDNFSFLDPQTYKGLHLRQMKITASLEDNIHIANIESDWFDVNIEGNIDPKEIGNQIMWMTESVFPDLIPDKKGSGNFTSDVDFDVIIKNNNSLTEFFNLPFRLLVPISITGKIESVSNTASLFLDLPYLQQGKDKLVYDSRLNVNMDGDSGTLDARIQTTMPVKRGDLALNINLYGHNNSILTDIRWVNTENENFKGHLTLDTDIKRNPLSFKPSFAVKINPSVLQMGSADWNLSQSLITYCDNYLTVDGFKIWHDNQFVEINGTASPNYEDMVRVILEDIDVDYVFDMLQINYVTFGGSATGEIAGHSLLSPDPVAETESFKIDSLSYNGAVVGDAIITSRWNNEEKEVEISADISNGGKRCVFAKGGIWLGRDSLSFDIDAQKVPVDFVQPFMAVFSSHVGGFASGDVKLFGTFQDIDMTGRIFADSVAVKLDYTNTIYHGSDSVFLNPGKIEIPHFTLYDKYGHSALLTGELTHRYFHDPSFTFRLSDAQDLLCYETNSDINPDWYGTIFGRGSALIRGVPGLVDISADMTVVDNSSFTFVLNDTQYAQDYQFLTFSDKRKEEKKKQGGTSLTVNDFKEMLRKNMTQEGSYSKFGIDIRATVTPQALFTLVMDPAAGDKIVARGQGALQIKYESDNDEMMMYGKYEIDEGNYNFSLQDIILRDFKIKDGSTISFNGNPLGADLNISATYRVNTNLSDLDKSFSTDRDLNRTNVPVDAVLMVNGNMQQPDITFDIELPTLTQDVERKVKSIISTDDMMNRQIIYLLALNRFYTPEYMGSSGNGGELAAVASSTISSQLSNILGQLTDKFSVSPSFRSDKGDFSDIEVDVALSSRLLNNRLLINGNFGYRDRSNSSTTFVGDFDVEYLLSKNGNLRLKAYNHFNDQNYYLREALTTQGLGLIYRRDFDNWFTFLKKKKKSEEEVSDNEEIPATEEDKETTEQMTHGTEN